MVTVIFAAGAVWAVGLLVVLALCKAADGSDRRSGLKGDSRHLVPAELEGLGVGAEARREGYRRAA